MIQGNESEKQNVWHIVGPPGTGKTTKVAARAKATVAERGPGSLVLASLTKAAAIEIAARDTGVDPDQVGTLHALCFHALDKPQMTEKHLEDWNTENPRYALSNTQRDREDDLASGSGSGEKPGDVFMSRLELLRHRRMPEPWPTELTRFRDRWRAWKESNNLLDFTDLLERAVDQVPVAPGSPSVLLGDEVQDWSKLETHLFRDLWGKHAETVVLVGDADQSIFGWRGADPRIFLDNPAPPGQRNVLEQSYRVPRKVHALAQRIIRTIHDREDVQYQPREEEGKVERSSATWRYPEDLMRVLIESFESSRPVLVLASCSYMLRPLLAVLRDRGLPFCNPYKRKRGDWNPLRGSNPRSKRKVTTAVDRVRAFLRPTTDDRDWTREELVSWIEKLSTERGALTRGAKARVKEENFSPSFDFLSLFEESALTSQGLPVSLSARSALEGNLAWFRRSLLDKGTSALRFAACVAEKRGPEALDGDSPIQVGTIHSVKGGEAPTVILFPDVSRRGMDESSHADKARLFYVGVTRARERVILCDPASSCEAGFW